MYFFGTLGEKNLKNALETFHHLAEALKRFKLSISCLLDKRFNQLSHSAVKSRGKETSYFNFCSYIHYFIFLNIEGLNFSLNYPF